TCSPYGGAWQHRGDAGESRHTGAKIACPQRDYCDVRATNDPHKTVRNRIGRRGRPLHGLFRGSLEERSFEGALPAETGRPRVPPRDAPEDLHLRLSEPNSVESSARERVAA